MAGFASITDEHVQCAEKSVANAFPEGLLRVWYNGLSKKSLYILQHVMCVFPKACPIATDSCLQQIIEFVCFGEAWLDPYFPRSMLMRPFCGKIHAGGAGSGKNLQDYILVPEVYKKLEATITDNRDLLSSDRSLNQKLKFLFVEGSNGSETLRMLSKNGGEGLVKLTDWQKNCRGLMDGFGHVTVPIDFYDPVYRGSQRKGIEHIAKVDGILSVTGTYAHVLALVKGLGSAGGIGRMVVEPCSDEERLEFHPPEKRSTFKLENFVERLQCMLIMSRLKDDDGKTVRLLHTVSTSQIISEARNDLGESGLMTFSRAAFDQAKEDLPSNSHEAFQLETFPAVELETKTLELEGSGEGRLFVFSKELGKALLTSKNEIEKALLRRGEFLVKSTLVANWNRTFFFQPYDNEALWLAELRNYKALEQQEQMIQHDYHAVDLAVRHFTDFTLKVRFHSDSKRRFSKRNLPSRG